MHRKNGVSYIALSFFLLENKADCRMKNYILRIEYEILDHHILLWCSVCFLGRLCWFVD